MCFSPQRRAIFQHLNFKKWSEHVVFCTFSLENVLLATAACNFSTSELQKVVRSWRVLYIFTSKCASRYSGVQFLISPLTTWLRTRRFNEPTFRLTGHTNHWKNTAFRDFSNIWRGCIFFLLTFALLHLLSSDSTFSSDFTFFWLYFISSAFHLCFSTLHIVGSYYLNFLRSFNADPCRTKSLLFAESHKRNPTILRSHVQLRGSHNQTAVPSIHSKSDSQVAWAGLLLMLFFRLQFCLLIFQLRFHGCNLLNYAVSLWGGMNACCTC